jgi:Protein of unknown function (DUF4230)
MPATKKFKANSYKILTFFSKWFIFRLCPVTLLRAKREGIIMGIYTSSKRKHSFSRSIILVPVIIGILLTVFTGCSRKINKKDMINKLHEIAELATVEFKLRKIIFAKQKKKFLTFGLGTATFVAWIEPKIQAGIDVDQINQNDVIIDETNKVIKVILPPIKIIGYDYNEENIMVDHNLTKDKVFNRFDLEDLEKIHRNTDKDIRTYLNFLGIKEEAEKSTQKFFMQYFKNLGYTGDISFKENNKPLIYFDLEREDPVKEI